MFRISLAVCSLITILALLQPVGSAQSREANSRLTVASNTAECLDAEFSSIQDAVDAAHPGDTIRVCPGKYREQIVVRKSIRLVADMGVILAPDHMVANGRSLLTSAPIAAVILVNGVENANIVGFTIDAIDNGIYDCSPRLVGILYQNTSGQVSGNSVRNVRLRDSFFACQSGTGMEVQSGGGQVSKVAIYDNAIDGYQNNGITSNGEGTHVDVEENTIASSGPAQNAIQIAFGATGIIENNTVSSDDWSLTGYPLSCSLNRTGILVFESNEVVISGNSLEATELGILVTGNNARISGNDFSKCSPRRGIALLGDSNTVRDNKLPPSDRAVIFIHGALNQVNRNALLGGSLGILEIADSWNNRISDNVFSVAYIAVHDPRDLPEPVPSK